MLVMLTADDLAARTDRVVAAAAATGRDVGLTVAQPCVLYDVFSVIVHILPAPVVMRVPTDEVPSATASQSRYCASTPGNCGALG